MQSQGYVKTSFLKTTFLKILVIQSLKMFFLNFEVLLHSPIENTAKI